MYEVNPDYTYLIINYNEGDYLKKIILNLLNMDISDSEVIIIDDNSIDDSVNNINELDINKYNITLIKNPIEMGYDKCLKKGIDIAKGNYIIAYTPSDQININDFSVIKNNLNIYDLILYNVSYEGKSSIYRDYLKKTKSIYIYLTDNILITNPLTYTIALNKFAYINVINKIKVFNRINLIKTFIANNYKIQEINPSEYIEGNINER